MPFRGVSLQEQNFCKGWLYMYVLNDNAYSVTEQNGSSRAR